jgi:hypothetical protein
VPAFIAALSTGSPAAFKSVQGITPAIQAAGIRAYQVANSQAFKAVFLVSLAFSGIGMILAIFYPSVDHLITSEVTIQVKKLDSDAESAMIDNAV